MFLRRRLTFISRWWSWRPYWISNRNDFNHLFFINKSPRYFIPNFESVGFLVQEKKFKIDFQDGGHGDHLGFPIGTILAIFNLLIVPMPKLSFKSIYSIGWEELLKMWKANGRIWTTDNRRRHKLTWSKTPGELMIHVIYYIEHKSLGNMPKRCFVNWVK